MGTSISDGSLREGWLWADIQDYQPLGTIDFETLQPDASEVSSASDCELVGSYSWQKKSKSKPRPTIQVPGYPPAWKERSLPAVIPRDEGRYCADQNAARSPEYTFEPLFQAAAKMNPSFRFDGIDVVISRNTLRRLFGFCRGHEHELKSFRVNLFIINDTLFVEPCAETIIEEITTFAGFGRNFEKVFTTPLKGTEESAGHHRVLRYPLGKLNCVVRFEIDACYRGGGGKAEDWNVITKETSTNIDESLAAAIKTLNLDGSNPEEPVAPSSSSSSKATTGFTNLTIISNEATGVMPQSIAAELKSTAKPWPPNTTTISAILPQLWFGRTPWLIYGHHYRGKFYKLRIANVVRSCIIWEKQNQLILKKVVSIIEQFRNIVKGNKSQPCVAIFENQGSCPRAISVYGSKLDDKRPLPEYLIKKFWTS